MCSEYPSPKLTLDMMTGGSGVEVSHVEDNRHDEGLPDGEQQGRDDGCDERPRQGVLSAVPGSRQEGQAALLQPVYAPAYGRRRLRQCA